MKLRRFALLPLLLAILFAANPAVASLFSGGMPSGAAAPVSYLPTVATEPTNVYMEGRKVISSYAGPIIQITKPSDQAQTMDVYAGADGKLDVSAVAAFCAPDNYCEKNKVYDQKGTGCDATQTVQAKRPWLMISDIVNGEYSAMFGGPAATSLQSFDIPSCATGNARSFTTVDIASYKSSNTSALGITGPNTFTAGSLGILPGNIGSGSVATGYRSTLMLTKSSGYLVAGSARGRSQPQVTTIASGASNIVAYQDNTTYTLGVNDSGTWAGGSIGIINGASASKFSGEHFGRIIYPTQLSGSDVATIHAWAYPIFGVLTNANTELVWSGTSLEEGLRVIGLQNIQKQMEPLLTKSVFISNQGVSGNTAAGVYSNVAYYQSQLQSGLSAHLFIATAISNDLDSTASGSIVGTGTTYFNNYVLPMITAMQGTGYTVAVPTVISRAWAGNSTDRAQKETERLAFNSLLISSAAANNYTVLDFAGVVQSQNPANSTYFYSDQVHPTAALDAYFAPIVAAWVNGHSAANDNPSPNMFAANDNWPAVWARQRRG